MKETGNFYKFVLVAVFLIALCATRNSFVDGYIASWDDPAHLVRAEHFYNSINLEMLGIFGWYHGWYLGVATFMFYPPGFFMVTAALEAATFGMIGMELIIKVVLALTFAAFPIVLYRLSKSLGFSENASVMAAVLSLGFSAAWGIGLAGIYTIGLYTNVFSLIPFALFWAAFHRTLLKNGNPAIAGLLLGFTIITSIIAAAFSFMLVAIYALVSILYRKRGMLAKFSVILAIGLLSSLFWTYPFLASRDLYGPETGFNPFGLVELVKQLFSGGIIYNPVVSFFLALGILSAAVSFYRKDTTSFSISVVVLTFLITVLVSSNLPTELTLSWQNSNALMEFAARGLRSILRMRALSFLWIIIPMIAAFGVDSALSLTGRVSKVLCANLATMTVVSMLLFSAWQLLGTAAAAVKTVYSPEYAGSYNVFESAFSWIKENANKNDVVLIDINWDNYQTPGTVSLDALLNLESGLRAVNGNQVEACSLNSWQLNHVVFSDTQGETELQRFGVNYVMSYRRPEYNASYLEKVYTSNDITIYKTHDLSGPYKTVGIDLGPNTYKIKLDVFKAGSIELPVQYNNHLNAEIDGQPASVGRSGVGLAEVQLTTGPHEVDISFRETGTEILAFAVSLMAIAVSAFTILKNRRTDVANALTKRFQKLPI
jgi:hypothetical protein